MKRKDGTQFIGKFANSKSKAAQESLCTLLMPHRLDKPLEGALFLQVNWCYPWRKSEPKKNRKRGFKYCDTRPDIDNLVKMLKDNMTRLAFWNDDSQVARLFFTKTWGEEPGIDIIITQLNQ
jgi:Holliday junction resolvase RusA-like endonuclease